MPAQSTASRPRPRSWRPQEFKLLQQLFPGDIDHRDLVFLTRSDEVITIHTRQFGGFGQGHARGFEQGERDEHFSPANASSRYSTPGAKRGNEHIGIENDEGLGHAWYCQRYQMLNQGFDDLRQRSFGLTEQRYAFRLSPFAFPFPHPFRNSPTRSTRNSAGPSQAFTRRSQAAPSR